MSVLEFKVDVWCVAAIADGASTNRKFFKLHKGLQDASYTGVIYYTVNLFAPQRKIYFFSDVPHLIKTSRNCLYSSGNRVGDVHTRCMWNNDQEVAIQHLPKITRPHQALIIRKDESKLCHSSLQQVHGQCSAIF